MQEFRDLLRESRPPRSAATATLLAALEKFILSLRASDRCLGLVVRLKHLDPEHLAAVEDYILACEGVAASRASS